MVTRHQYVWGKTHSGVFKRLSQSLNREKIKYFVLRNYAGLPDINNSKDVDVVVAPKDAKSVHRILMSILKENGFEYVQINNYGVVVTFLGFNLIDRTSIEIDILSGFKIKGFEPLQFSYIYNSIIEYNQFYIVSKPIEVIMLLLLKIIGWEKVKPIYRQEIAETIKNNSEEFHRYLAYCFSSANAQKCYRILESEEYHTFKTLGSKLRLNYRIKAILRNPFKTILEVSKFYFYRITMIFRKAKMIAVLGADGTGKSTFIDGLGYRIASYYMSDLTKCHIYHHRPTILPNLGSVGEKAKMMKQDTDFTNPHRGKPAGFISSLIRMIYYWLDYVIGVPAKFRKDVQFDRFTIYDRYIYDFLIDPKRTRINLPYWLRLLFTKLVIRPRIVFILAADAQTIYERKQELTVVEINRQLGELDRLAKTNKRFVVIDANQSPEKMVDDAMKIILDRFTTKIK